MTDRPKPLSADELADLLEKLDSVMREAAKLRAQVTRQLTEYRDQQQSITAPERPRKTPRRSR